MRIGKVHHECCPICEYEIQHCQCIFAGNAHPDRNRRIRIVKDHLEMLSPKQVGHLIALEDWWQTSYGDEEDAKEFERFKTFIERLDEPQTMYYPQVDGITPSVIVNEPQTERSE